MSDEKLCMVYEFATFYYIVNLMKNLCPNERPVFRRSVREFQMDLLGMNFFNF